MIQWEIVQAAEFLQQLPLLPPPLHHGMAFLPFTPALSLSPDVICPAYVVTYEILSVVPTLLHWPSSNPPVLGLQAVLPEPALRIGQKDRNAEGAGKVEL